MLDILIISKFLINDAWQFTLFVRRELFDFMNYLISIND